MMELTYAADGFFEPAELSEQLTFNNVRFLRNEVSPFHEAGTIVLTNNAAGTVDSYYGHAYNAQIAFPLAFYGKTEELPSYGGDSLANYGYLRVPFRRVPRRIVHSRSELNDIISSIVSADPSLELHFRGQEREYTLKRSERAREILFGDSSAVEPSLLASSSRSGLSLETVSPEWSLTVQMFMAQYLTALRNNKFASLRILDDVCAQMTNLVSGYNLWAFLLALAQHYGLPSAGLDVTSSLDVALYFALTGFEKDPDASYFQRTKRLDEMDDYSVIYLFANTQRFVIDYSSIRPLGFPLARPDAQSAHFLHTGWGLARNAVAENLFLALYLDRSKDWGSLPKTKDMFPGPDKDIFGSFLYEAALRGGSPAFSEFIQKFYWAI